MRRFDSYRQLVIWHARITLFVACLSAVSPANADYLPHDCLGPDSLYADSIARPDYMVEARSEVHDSILQRIFLYARAYSEQVRSYEAELYLKGVMHVHNRNRIIRYVPSMFRFEKGVNDYIHESISDLHYTSPNIYDRKVRAVSTTLPGDNSRFFDILDYLKFNIYSPVTMDDKIVSPFRESTSRHYRFMLDSVFYERGEECMLIRVMPRFRSTQLIEGRFLISTLDWRIKRMVFDGHYEVVTFHTEMKMGDTPQTRFLPELISLRLEFSFMKNYMEMDYTGWIKYKSVSFQSHDDLLMRDLMKKSRYKSRKYNLSNSYTLTSDTTQVIKSAESFHRMRPIPLSELEDSLYAAYASRLSARNDSIRSAASDTISRKPKSGVLWGQIGDALISSYRIDISKFGSVKCSPLINPLLIGYSRRKGLSYRQVFKYNKIFPDGRRLRIAPQIGYNFTKKELYAKLTSQFVYNPFSHAAVEFEIGNGNRIYSSVVIDKLKEMSDDSFSFDGLDLDYFKDVYINLFHSIDIANGLNLRAGLSLHWRHTKSTPEVEARVQSSYNSFAPRVRIEWTPGMYYYISGKRKIDVGSHYPTFVLDVEKGIQVLNNSGHYFRAELSAEQTIRIHGIHTLAYHVGGGFFAETDDLYFVDYVDFADRNLPQGWNDDIGGTFQQLGSRWYNSASNYIRANATFETPFILLYPFTRVLSFIQKERLYGGIVFLPHLNPYVEIGYGIGTHVFDLGIFSGFKNGEFYSAGVKFTFELFNKY